MNSTLILNQRECKLSDLITVQYQSYGLRTGALKEESLYNGDIPASLCITHDIENGAGIFSNIRIIRLETMNIILDIETRKYVLMPYFSKIIFDEKQREIKIEAKMFSWRYNRNLKKLEKWEKEVESPVYAIIDILIILGVIAYLLPRIYQYLT